VTRESRRLLIKALRNKGKVTENIIKVDTFLNHCVDINLVKHIGQDIARYYTGTSIDKIITVEASGIIPAMAAAMYIGCDMIYAKKKITSDYGKTLFSKELFLYKTGGDDTARF